MGGITKIILYIVGICVVFTGYIFWGNLSKNFNIGVTSQITVGSSDFTAQNVMPSSFTCQGQNLNPQLSFGNIPDGTKSLAIDMVDTNTLASEYVHWFMWGINSDAENIPRNVNSNFASTGLNSYGKVGYSGPCPTSGTHHYRFEVYALDKPLNLKNGSSYGEFQSAIKNHTVGYGSMLGLYQYQTKDALKLSTQLSLKN